MLNFGYSLVGKTNTTVTSIKGELRMEVVF